MLLRIAYCDDEIENGKKIKDYINQFQIHKNPIQILLLSESLTD